MAEGRGGIDHGQWRNPQGQHPASTRQVVPLEVLPSSNSFPMGARISLFRFPLPGTLSLPSSHLYMPPAPYMGPGQTLFALPFQPHGTMRKTPKQIVNNFGDVPRLP